MKTLKIILSMFILSTYLNATTLENALNEYKIKSSYDFMLTGGYYDSDIQLPDNTQTNKKMYLGMTSFYARYHISHNNTEYRISPFIYGYTTDTNEKLKNKLTDETYEYSEIFFREFYIKQNLNNQHSIGFGIVPFSDNSFKEHQYDHNKKGEGLNILLDIDAPTIFYSYKYNENIKMQIGGGKFKWMGMIPKGNYIDKANEDSMFYWSLLDIKHSERIKSYSQIIYSDGKYNNTPAAKIMLLGTGFSYDDSDNSGFIGYFSIGYSHYKNHTAGLEDEILANHDLNPTMVSLFPESFGFNNNTYEGYAGLVGIRKDFEISHYDAFIDYEYFRTSDNWFSFNNGTFYKNTFNTAYDIRNESHMFITGIFITNQLLIKLIYNRIDYDETIKIGAMPDTVPYDDYIGGGMTVKTCTKLELNYAF